MENVVAVNKSKRYVSDDPHFPCNALEERYVGECYQMQTSRMLELGLSYEKIGLECEKVGKFRYKCMKSLGRDASNDARNNPTSAKICANLSIESDRHSCIAGLVYALADNSWDGQYAFPYCDNLPSDLVEYCYTTTINYLKGSLFIDKVALENSCKVCSSYPECSSIIN